MFVLANPTSPLCSTTVFGSFVDQAKAKTWLLCCLRPNDTGQADRVTLCGTLMLEFTVDGCWISVWNTIIPNIPRIPNNIKHIQTSNTFYAFCRGWNELTQKAGCRVWEGCWQCINLNLDITSNNCWRLKNVYFVEDSSEHLSNFFRIAQIAHFVGDNSMHPNPDFSFQALDELRVGIQGIGRLCWDKWSRCV